MWLVYKHTSPSNKVYIGITSKSNPKERWKNGKGYKRHQPLFYNAIKKYGWANFKHEVLFENITEKDAKIIEIDLIYYYKKNNKSYNITDGGSGTKGRSNSSHARKLISEAQVKKSVDQYDLNGNYLRSFDSMIEASKFIGKAVYKNNHWTQARGLSKACKEGCVAYNFRWKFASESTLNIASKQNLEKEIVQLSLNDEFICYFKSGKEAEEKTGVSRKLISPCCLGKRKTAKKFKWMFYKDYITCMNLKEDIINVNWKDGSNNKSNNYSKETG